LTDTIVRGVARGGFVRAMACVTTGLVNELQRRHGTWPVATAALGRTASLALMMAWMLKGKERVTLQLKGDGPLGAITVDADSLGNVRGYVENPNIHLPPNALGKLDVGGGVGRGMLYVMRDMGLKDVYRGSSEIQSGEIADDLTYYFAISEQIPSSVGAGVLVEVDNSVIVSGGFIVQLLPGHSEEDIRFVEEHLSGLESVTQLLLEGLNAKGLLQRIAPFVETLEERNVQFACSCSKIRLKSVLKTLGDLEIQSMILEQGQAEIICHFCNQQYLFSKLELESLIF